MCGYQTDSSGTVPVRKDDAGNDIKPTTGLVFMPGARIDSRAYAHVLRPLAEAGYLVAVLKEPFGFSLFDGDHGKKVLDVHPEITDLGSGRSLARRHHGCLTCGRGRTRQRPCSLRLLPGGHARPYRSEGGLGLRRRGRLRNTGRIEASKGKLPPDTSYVVINGAVHSSFGDYGEQSGDGIATVDRSVRRARSPARPWRCLPR